MHPVSDEEPHVLVQTVPMLNAGQVVHGLSCPVHGHDQIRLDLEAQKSLFHDLHDQTATNNQTPVVAAVALASVEAEEEAGRRSLP